MHPPDPPDGNPRPYKPGTALRPNEVDEAVGL